MSNKFLSALLLSLSPLTVLAADRVKSSAEKAFLNPSLTILMVLIIVLLFAIWGLSGVLRNLGGLYKTKMREGKINLSAKVLMLMLGLSVGSFSSKLFAQETVTAPAPAKQLIDGLSNAESIWLIGIIAFELIIITGLLVMIRMVLARIAGKSEYPVPAIRKVKRISFWTKFHGSVTIEREQDILLDHNYDGIQELDNSLPPWWKYGFYLTIIVAVTYFWYYHLGGNGPSSRDEYVMSVQKAEEEKAAYLASSADKVDESNVKPVDASGLADGKTLFQKNCAPCHATDGGGIVGPNLTDDYWLHGGGLADVFKSIKYGWQDKGMKSWKDDFSPKQIAELASYIKSLKGTKPAAPKDKQGDLYSETPAADTSKTKGKPS